MRLRGLLELVLLCTVLASSLVLGSRSSEAAQSDRAVIIADCSTANMDCLQTWEGKRSHEGRSQTMLLQVRQSGSGQSATVDLPDFGALDIPASKFGTKGGRVHFELVGDSSSAIFDGDVRGDDMHGSWTEGGRGGDFNFKLSHAARKAIREEEVSFQSGGVRLAGTLLLPDLPARAPAIVFVHGAGAEKRSASRFLAEFFAKRGVAALIYDKRGTGASSGDWKHSSFDDLAGDVSASVHFLQSRSDVDPHRIGLMGSSQGGWVAPMAALSLPDLAFVIAKSAAPVTPEAQELARVGNQMRTQGYGPAEVDAALGLYRHAIEYARSRKGWESLNQKIEADSNQKWAIFDKGTPSDFWFFDQIRSDFNHDPLLVLRQLRSPLLVIYGGEDQLGPPLEKLLGPLLDAMRSQGKASELQIFPNAGHDLRVETAAGQVWDFPRFAPGYLDSLASWVKLHTQ